jgi:hypothetical protein
MTYIRLLLAISLLLVLVYLIVSCTVKVEDDFILYQENEVEECQNQGY